jgi:hypothetical protein
MIGHMESMADILADTKRYRAETIKTLKAVKAGAPLRPGMTKESAVKLLEENIAHFDTIIRRYDWRKKNAQGS